MPLTFSVPEKGKSIPPVVSAPRKHSATKLGGMLTRRERWGLSGAGWLLLSCLVLAAMALTLLATYPFLAVTDRADARLLVVEGWVRDFAIEAGMNEFNTGMYERIYTTGGPVSGSGRYTTDANTTASVGAGRLRAMGMSGDLVQMVPARASDVDRTYGSAVALRDWLKDHEIRVEGMNVVTQHVHARRTRLLFQKAFGGNVRVGVIAAPTPDYDATRWWRDSQGVRDVVGEAVAYLYARFFFYPSR